MSDIHINDVGTLFEIILKDNNIIVDISTATSKILYIQKPDGTVLTKIPVFATNGVDGKLHYVSILGDFSVKGTYKLQCKVTLPSWEGYSAVGSFKVLANLTI